jgi:hypothetical protein
MECYAEFRFAFIFSYFVSKSRMSRRPRHIFAYVLQVSLHTWTECKWGRTQHEATYRTSDVFVVSRGMDDVTWYRWCHVVSMMSRGITWCHLVRRQVMSRGFSWFHMAMLIASPRSMWSSFEYQIRGKHEASTSMAQVTVKFGLRWMTINLLL